MKSRRKRNLLSLLETLAAVFVVLAFAYLYLLAMTFDWGEYDRAQLLWSLPLAFGILVAAKWLMLGWRLRPRRRTRFLIVLALTNAVAFALAAWLHDVILRAFAHFVLLPVIAGEFALYRGTGPWTGLRRLRQRRYASRAMRDIMWANLILAFVVHLFVGYTSYLHDPTHRVSDVKSDLRSIATAVESYIVDHNMTPDTLHRLTTPIAYTTGWMGPGWRSRSIRFADLFTDPERPFPYAYFSTLPTGSRYPHWILWSMGPDRDNDLDLYHLRRFLAPVGVTEETLETLKIHYTYDPTNGSYSNGDLWRIRK